MDKETVFRLEDYKRPPYALPKVALCFKLHPTQTRVLSKIEVQLQEGEAVGTPLVLDGDALKLLSIRCDGQELGAQEYCATEKRLEIFSPKGAHFILEIETEINPESNRQLMGLYRSNGVFCTQCEAEGFRRITYYYDRPDVLSIYTVTLEAEKASYPVLLSNGNCIEQGEKDAHTHYAIWHDPHPKPSYLFALVAGNLEALKDRFTTQDGREVALAIYTELGKKNRALYAMDALKRSMRWDEIRFGCVYDLDVFNIVAVSDFNMGAMENKGLNIFNDKFVLADPETATDSDYAGIERVIAHEYFHNWTGNRITCRDWFQLCLKEGLTVYRDQEFCSDERSRAVQRISNVRLLKAAQFVEDAGPLAHPVRPRQYKEINNFYTTTVYEKGAELVRMIHTMLGDVLFRKGLDLYFKRHDGQACTIEDFIACFRDVSQRDFSQFMLWYEQAGTPHVEVEWHQEGDTLTLSFTQHIPDTPGQVHKKPMVIPIRFGLVQEDGNDSPYESCETEGEKIPTEDILLLTTRQKTFKFSGVKNRVIPSLFRGFSSPVIVKQNMDDKARAFLGCYDKDPVNRWTNLTSLLFKTLIEGATEPHKNISHAAQAHILPTLGQIIENRSLEPAFRALCLSLPSEGEIASQITDNLDPARVHQARLALMHSVAQAHRESFAKILNTTKPVGSYQPNAEQAGQRALANTALCYLAIAEKSPQRVKQHFYSADNMTDKVAALAILTSHFSHDPTTEECLQHFEETYRAFPLVMDKWFSLKACICDDKALERVQTLTKHPLFSFENPNRTRALIGAFAAGNFVGFHQPSGAAYDYFTDIILMIDKKNSQLSSRLLTALRSWRTLESTRKALAQKALEKIAAHKGLSTDLSDIVERMLQKS